MEKIIKDILKLKIQYEQELKERLDEFIENEEIENHVDVILFKKRIVWCQCFILELNRIITNNTPS